MSGQIQQNSKEQSLQDHGKRCGTKRAKQPQVCYQTFQVKQNLSKEKRFIMEAAHENAQRHRQLFLVTVGRMNP
jgi:hypothetical protein